MPKQNVVYTCITNSYDPPLAHNYINPDWDYILYTDNQELLERGQYEHWQVRPTVFSELDNTRNARYHKINAHKLLPEYTYSLYVDGNVNIMKPLVFERVEGFIAENKAFVVPLHFLRNCLYQEAITVIYHKIENEDIVVKQVNAFREDNFPEEAGLYDTSTLLRQHNESIVQEVQELWWQTVRDQSKRDQLSHVYAAWKKGLEITPFFKEKKRYRYGKEFQISFAQSHDRHLAPEATISSVSHTVPKNDEQVFEHYKVRFAQFNYLLSYINNKFTIANEHLTISGPSINTLWTCFDVLCKGDYNLAQKNDYIFFDIGFNIGSVTVLKAQDEKCKKIYAFEPFKETYALGLSNVNNNRNSEKIEVFNYGLSNEDKSLEFNYNPERPGAMSTSKEVFDTGIATKIELKQASSILAPLFEKHNQSIVLKIDCEGSEFEIIEDLEKHGLLSKVDAITMEWHFKSPQFLIDTLIKNDFIVFNETIRTNDLGFMKAVRK